VFARLLIQYGAGNCKKGYSEPRGVEHVPRILRLFIRPPATFRNPLRAVFSKIEIFSGTAKFSSLYAGAPRVPPRVLAVLAKILRGQYHSRFFDGMHSV